MHEAAAGTFIEGETFRGEGEIVFPGAADFFLAAAANRAGKFADVKTGQTPAILFRNSLTGVGYSSMPTLMAHHAATA